jgi:hypothetical protein
LILLPPVEQGVGADNFRDAVKCTDPGFFVQRIYDLPDAVGGPDKNGAVSNVFVIILAESAFNEVGCVGSFCILP